MLRYFHTLLSAAGYAPHGYCLLWQPELIWTHVLADAVTALAYFSIPVALVMLVRKRGDVEFGWLFLCFASFIMACGASHVMSIVTLWKPWYGQEALVKLVMAVVSVATAGALWPLMPRLLAIPSPTQLRQANEALAARITERDAAIASLQAEIAERQRAEARLEAQGRDLQAATAAAQSASHAKSQFLANMSHELRTPLNAVMGYAQLLIRAPDLAARHAHAARTIHDSGSHLLTLITDILDLAKIEAGKLELSPASLDLRGFLQGIAAIITPRAQDKGLAFACNLPPDLPAFVEADAKRLRQVLLNLLGNAVKFTDSGMVSLEVTHALVSAAKTRLALAVRDTGVGIAQGHLGTIFQPFEQVGALDRRGGGTGLGLSISRQLVELMHSKILVDSRPDHGSCFSFTIDLPLAHAAPAQATGPDCTGYRGSRRRVLVVDTVAANRGALVAMLAQLGFAVEEATDPQAALAHASACQPDLVLIDIAVPPMAGLAAIAALHADETLRSLPVVAMSSAVAPEDMARALAAGARAFLPKPLDRGELIGQLGEILQLEWLHGGPGEAPPLAQAPATTPLVAPPREAMATLHQLARAGNMRAIRHEAQRIAMQNPAWRGFADRVERLARAFQSQALLTLIETSLETAA